MKIHKLGLVDKQGTKNQVNHIVNFTNSGECLKITERRITNFKNVIENWKKK